MPLKKSNQQFSLPKIQEDLFKNPQIGVQSHIKKIYKENKISLGWPKNETRVFSHLARENTMVIVGVALGDEGKGRLVDNKIEELLKRPRIKNIHVVRFQGGNNAGHTVEKDGVKVALHLVPSCVMHQKAVGIMDQGMVIHPQDLQTEVENIEEKISNLKGRLFLSQGSILCTDLERAEEVLNGLKKEAAKGGTGRGIAPAYAHHYDRLGLRIYELLEDNWEGILGNHYDRYEKEFAAFGVKLAKVEIPDFKSSYRQKAAKKPVGNKNDFLNNLKEARTWLLKRKITVNTFLLHKNIYRDKSQAVIFEGSQAAGLDAWLGTRPDVTSSNTSVFGLREGTGFWMPQLIEERIGVFKATYTSSVGARRMPTHVDLPKDLNELPKNASSDQKWAAFVREEAFEYGTTTGRPRDINFLDLPFLCYNARISGIEVLTATHLDIAREFEAIKVSTHYEDKKGNYIPYQPGLRYQKEVVPQYIELPGWGGVDCRKVKKLKDLPVNALKFLAFIQARTGFPITCVTTGSSRENILNFPEY